MIFIGVTRWYQFTLIDYFTLLLFSQVSRTKPAAALCIGCGEITNINNQTVFHLNTLLCCCSLLGKRREMCLLYHIVRWRVNRICVDFLLIVLTWGLGSDPATGAAQMERHVPLLSASENTDSCRSAWIKSENYSTICQ